MRERVPHGESVSDYRATTADHCRCGKNSVQHFEFLTERSESSMLNSMVMRRMYLYDIVIRFSYRRLLKPSAFVTVLAVCSAKGQPVATEIYVPPLDSYSTDLNKGMKPYTEAVLRSLSNQRMGVMIPTATAMPYVGRLIRLLPTGEHETCSATLISASVILTAAHCLCEHSQDNGYWLTAKECIQANALSTVRTSVFFPTAGVFGTTGRVSINPDYHMYSGAEVIVGSRPLADLAVVQLAGAPPIQPVKISHNIEEPTRLISDGFGAFTTMPDPRSPKAESPSYDVGLENAIIQRGMACRPGYTDVTCSHYSPMNFDLSVSNAASCDGDSGGPLLDISTGADPFVFGVTSERESHHGQIDCSSSSDALTTYTLSGPHATWIEAEAKSLNSSKTPKNKMLGCIEGRAHSRSPWTFKLLPFEGAPTTVFSASVVAEASSTVSPFVDFDGGAAPTGCVFVEGLHTTVSCQRTGNLPISLRISESTLAQVSICGYDER